MSLYSDDEICNGCIHAYNCEKCGKFEFCEIDANKNYMTGKCEQKEINYNDSSYCSISQE